MRESIFFAVGIGLSPLPILTMLLLLGSPRPATNGVAFWLGWVGGVAVPTVALVVAFERSEATDGSAAGVAVAELAVGLVFIGIALRLLFRGSRRSRPVPWWLEALDRSGPGRAAAIALVLSVCNPKNLALMLAGAVAIAEARNVTVATSAFLGVAVFAVTLALVIYVVRRDASAARLAALREAIARRDRPIAIVLGLALGAFFVADALRAL